MGASFLLSTFGGGADHIKSEDRFEDEEIATGNQGDLGQFFKHGSTGLDTFLTNVAVKEEPDMDAFSFRWDDDEELKLNGSDSEDNTPSLLLDSEDHLLLSSGLLSFDDLTLHSTSTTSSLTSTSPCFSSLSSLSLSSPLPSSSSGSKGSSPSSPAPSSSPLPSSPSSLLPAAPFPSSSSSSAFPHQSVMTYSQHHHHCSGPTPHFTATVANANGAHTSASPAAAPSLPPPAPVTTLATLAVQSAPTTPSSSPRAPRKRRESTTAGSGKSAAAAAKKAAGPGNTPPRPRRRRAASTTVARDKQDRMEKELLANDDKAKAILSGPLTLEKLSSLSTLKVSVLQKQLKMVNASTKGSKAQLIQRLVRYMYLFSQQHRHQAHHPHHMLCSASTCGIQQQHPQQQQQQQQLPHHQHQHQHPASVIGTTGGRCSGPFVDPTLINAGDSVRVKAAAAAAVTAAAEQRSRSGSVEGPSVLSTSAPSSSSPFAAFLSTHVHFPTPLQITLTGRIVEEEEEEEFSD